MVDPTEKILAWYASQGITVTLAMLQIIRGNMLPPWSSPWPRAADTNQELHARGFVTTAKPTAIRKI